MVPIKKLIDCFSVALMILLDTHVWVWTMMDSPRLTSPARHLIEASQGPVYVSSVSVWEVHTKVQIGKLVVRKDLRDATELSHLEFLAFGVNHAEAVGDLPLHHRDPFDRALVAQAKIEGVSLLTYDQTLAQYRSEVLIRLF